jgi:solute carrier family 35 protein C2
MDFSVVCGMDAPTWRRHLVILALILIWYLASITIVFANKHLLTNLQFHYPFVMTASTNAVVATLACLITRLPRFRQPALARKTIQKVVVPIGLCTALDIGFSNWSLLMVSVSFHMIIKGTIPAFVLLAGWLLRLEPMSTLTAASIALVCIGIGLASSAEVSFSGFGLLTGLASAAMSGLRWALTQLLMKGRAAGSGESIGSSTSARASDASSCRTSANHPSADHSNGAAPAVGPEPHSALLSRHSHPLGSVMYISPVTAICALVPALAFESEIFESPFLSSAELSLQLLAFLAIVSALVLVLLLAEFWLVKLTSSLTLSILGILKELLTILLAAVTRGDHLTVVNLSGFAICSLGVLMYNCVKQRKQVNAMAAAALHTAGVRPSGWTWLEIELIEELADAAAPETAPPPATELKELKAVHVACAAPRPRDPAPPEQHHHRRV